MVASSSSSSSSSGKKVSLDRSYEENLAKTGSHQHIIGCDEAGRGPLAGPVTAAAVYVEPGTCLEGVMDSKALTAEVDREKAYNQITKHPNVLWSVISLENSIIDEINILQATLKAMQMASTEVVEKLSKRANGEKILTLIDGNKVPKEMHSAISTTMSVVKGDSLCFSIAAASILAKVTRDRIMNDLDKKYPLYGFLQNKGYPTPVHRNALLTYGPSHVHRVSYKPVREAMEKHDMDTLPPPSTPQVKAKDRTIDSDVVVSSSDSNSNGRTLRPRKRLESDFDSQYEDFTEQAAITRASTEEIKYFATVVSTLLHTEIPCDMKVKEMKRKFASLMPVTRERLGVKDVHVETEVVKEETTDEPIVATPHKARSPSRARRGRS